LPKQPSSGSAMPCWHWTCSNGEKMGSGSTFYALIESL
jgi:hypothetical protein